MKDNNDLMSVIRVNQEDIKRINGDKMEWVYSGLQGIYKMVIRRGIVESLDFHLALIEILKSQRYFFFLTYSFI